MEREAEDPLGNSEGGSATLPKPPPTGIGEGLDGPLRASPRNRVAPAEPALEKAGARKRKIQRSALWLDRTCFSDRRLAAAVLRVLGMSRGHRPLPVGVLPGHDGARARLEPRHVVLELPPALLPVDPHLLQERPV